ncbi:MAG: DNA adenine methylase [Bacteroidales bacterium]
MGSKRRIAKYILSIILKNRKEGQYFVDIFCGGCNLIDKVNGNRIANDNNPYLIALFREIVNNGISLSKVDKETYYKVKANKYAYPEWYVGHVGFNCSSMGKWFESFVCDEWITKSEIRNYQTEHINNLLSQVESLHDVSFFSCDYRELTIPPCSIIYCDPPYKNTIGYRQKFDHDAFWQWCRDMAKQGHSVFISEYEAPEDFTCIWEMEIKDTLSHSITKLKKERLFVVN